MTGEWDKASLAKVGAAAVPAWFVFVWLMFSPDWHPAGLMAGMLPVLPMDLAAAALRLTMHGLPELGTLALIIFSAVGLGGLLLRPFGLDTDGGRRLTLSLGLGLAALSYLTLFTGLAGMYDAAGRMAVLAVLAPTSVAGVFSAVKAARGLRGRSGPGWPDAVFLALLALVSVFMAAKALRPAVFYDAVTYHLGVPNYYIQEGGISYIPYDSYSNFPFAAEMLYTLGMFVSGLKLAQLTSVAVFIAFVLLVYEFTRSFLPDVPPALPAAFCLLTPAFMEDAALYTNDLHLAYFSLLAVYCFFALERTGGGGWAALMGIFTGVCIGTKYIALVSIVVPAFLAACYIAYKDRAKGGRAAVRTVPIFSLSAAAAASPWLIKNWINTGNPFYPALYGIFGGEDMTATLYAVHTAAAGHTTLAEGVRGLLAHPWELFMAGPAYAVVKYGAASMLGPALIMFAPLLLIVKGVDPVVKKLCLFAAMLFVIWSLAFPLTRFLYPAIAVMIVAASYALARVFRSAPGATRAFVVLAVSVCLTFDLCLGFFQVDKWTGAYGLDRIEESDYDYIVRRAEEGGTVMLQGVPVYEWINENAPKDARVLIIGDAQHLYIDRRHLYAYLSAKSPYDFFGVMRGDNAAIAGRLKSEGVTHIVYNPGELKRLRKAGYAVFAEADDAHVEDFLKSGYVRPASASRLHGRPVFGFEIK